MEELRLGADGAVFVLEGCWSCFGKSVRRAFISSRLFSSFSTLFSMSTFVFLFAAVFALGSTGADWAVWKAKCSAAALSNASGAGSLSLLPSPKPTAPGSSDSPG